jgi:hypothetical protein
MCSWRDRFPDFLAVRFLGFAELIQGLQVEPVLRRGPHPPRQAKGGIGGNPALALDDLGHPIFGNAEYPGKLRLRHANFFDVYPEMLSRMDGWTRHLSSLSSTDSASVISVIIDDLDIESFSPLVRPFKTDTPTIIDANAVLTGAITLQGFKSISRWKPQVVQ